MIITCASKNRMGYIHLMPVNNNNLHALYEEHLNNNHLSKYLNIESINIPISSDFQYGDLLNKMRISNITYKQASSDAKEFIEEYQNDLDINGYMEGVELNLSKKEFLTLINENAFQIFKCSWHSKDFIILTLDISKNVFHENNIIYPFCNEKDAFAIVKIEKKYKTGFIKGIITSREDLYPFSYLSKPEFILLDDVK
ncbi:hypothetical protein [Acetivibrio cellulolyticus]|uniref:hypothetical protein n=1 Tax=Acetivibrio cellulolyticus TaxID=35830 RepID=UPI0001E2E72C|nr:hypothetical protein [Acetivibrio cellulolyticus]